MKTKILILTMLTGFACLIFSTASLAQTDDYQKIQDKVFGSKIPQKKGGTPGLWTGAVSSTWHNPLNWDDGVVPGSTVDVNIPAPPSNQPVINSAHANCKSLTIHPWASLTIEAYYLTIQNDLTVFGTLNKNSASGLLIVYGDVVWESGSTAGFTANSSFRVYGDWNFNEGANVNFANGAVDFMGTGDSWIRCYSDNCSFNNLRIYKSSANTKVSNLSTHDLVINGLTFVDTHATFESFTSENILMGGDFIYYGSFDFTMLNNDGSVIFNGISQTIDNYGSGSGTFGHIVFNSSIGTFVVNDDFNVARNLTIEQGYFNAGSSTITVGGNWTNNAGAGGFNPTSSTIIFESSGDHQDVTGTNTFYNVTQLNAGKYLRFFGPTTIQNNLALNYLCWAYQSMNISGMLDLSNVGSRFTANTDNANVTIALLNQGGKLMANGAGSIIVNDLVQNYVGGIIEAGTSSLIDITNSGLEPWIDLKGSLYNYGGTINLSGDFCYWPFANGAHLEMTDGIIDIKTCGLTIYHLYDWTHNITGGTIRTSKGFSGNRADFTPTAGTFEFYGSGDYFISQTYGCNVHNVKIAKSDNGEDKKETSEPVYDNRSGEMLSDGGKANTIYLNSDFAITGNLDIEAGTLSIGQYAFNIIGNTNISGNLDMTHDLSVINAHGDVVWNSGSTANFTAANVFIAWGHWNFENGSNANFTDGTILFRGNTSKFIRSHSQTSSFNNVESDKTDGAEVRVSNNSSTPLTINGNIYVHPEAVFGIYSIYDVILKGDINSNGTLLCNHGRVVLNGTNQSLELNTGSYFNNLAFNQSGTLTINNSLSDILDVKGNVEIQSGVFNLQDREIYVGVNWTNNAGVSAFDPGTGKVIFESSGDQQSVYGANTFYDVQQLNTGNYVRFHDNTTIQNNLELAYSCYVYDQFDVIGVLNIDNPSSRFKALGPGAVVTIGVLDQGGTMDCSSGATIQINDLQETGGLYGTYILFDAELNIYQDVTKNIDLSANLNIQSGIMNIYGGMPGSTSWWPGISASLTMSGGVLDIKDQTIYVRAGGTFSNYITGGKIRTSKGYLGHRPDFTPTAGTFEFYGSDNAYLEQVFGSTLHHLLINKTATVKDDGSAPVITHSTREMKPLSDGGKSSDISFNSNFTITGNLDVEAGTLINQDVNNTILGNSTINAGGKFEMNGAAWLVMGGSTSLTVNNGGELRLTGDESHYVLITGDGGRYALNVESGGTIGADSAYFEYTDTNGINIKPGALVDPFSAFNSCVFTMGHADGTLLTLDNDQSLQILNARFPSSHSTYNVTKNNNSGVVTFVDYIGSFSGSDHEQDIHNHVHWTGDPSVEITLDGIAVGAGQNLCFEAQQTILTGGAQNFVVESAAAVNLVAGESILMLPGTHAHSGSYLHARISDLSFCSGQPFAMVAAVDTEHQQTELNEITSHIHQNLFKVYPNPVRGVVTLELLSHESARNVVVEVYNLMGQNLMNKVMEAKPQYQIDLTGLQNGVYIFKVTHGKNSDFARLIKQ
ncbi:MAG: T9SS type A sorting domain-containing protein [Bacteroidales bacterium]|nr:T9SS type A sorting domain-containing protein [Bacteroidales bacterium]